MKQGALIAAFSLLSAVAVAGWMRTSAPAQQAPNQLMTAGYNTPGFTPDMAQQQAGVPQQFAGTAPVYTSAPAPAPVVRVQRPRAVRQATYSEARPVMRTVRKQRPTSHSVAIVAGGAGAGAAIGALAGGGKGAAIGAITGGAAGLIYDRMTAKPKTVMSY